MIAPAAQDARENNRDEIFQRYDYLCVNAARRYRGDPICYDDLLQIGRLGLIKAIDRYNPYLGVPFPAYAWAAAYASATASGEAPIPAVAAAAKTKGAQQAPSINALAMPASMG